MRGYAPFLGQVRLVPYPNFRLGQSAAEGCELLGFQVVPVLTPDPALQAKIEQARASGRQIVEQPSSRSRSSLYPPEPGSAVTADMVPGTELWACPPTWRSRYAQMEKPSVTAGPTGAATGPSVIPPTGPAEAAPFPVALAIGGVAAAGLVAFLLLR